LAAPARGAESGVTEDINCAIISKYGIDVEKIKFSKTVQNHKFDLNPRDTSILVNGEKITRTFRGELNRPYIDNEGTFMLVKEIMLAKQPEQDAYLPNALKWVVSGKFNGKNGDWELIIDKTTNTVVHFLFK